MLSLRMISQLLREYSREFKQTSSRLDLTRLYDLQKMFSPVVESTEKSTKAITEELALMREKIKNLNEKVLHQLTAESRSKRRRGEKKLNVVEQYLPTNFADGR